MLINEFKIFIKYKKKISLFFIFIFFTIVLICYALLFRYNALNLDRMNNTTQMSIHLSDLHSMFRLKNNHLKEYLMVPSQINLNAYDRVAQAYEEQVILMSSNLIPGKIEEIFHELLEKNNQYDAIFYDDIVSKMDDNLRLEAEISNIQSRRVSSEYEEMHRFLAELLDIEMEKRISIYKRSLNVMTFILTALLLSLVLIVFILAIALYYKKKYDEKNKAYNEAMTVLANKEKLASLGILLSGVAHEINTPLGNAFLGTSFLKEKLNHLKQVHEKKTPPQAEFDAFMQTTEAVLDSIDTNHKRAIDIIKKFKMLSSNQSITEELVSFNLYHTLRETLDLLNDDLLDQKVKIQLKCHRNMVINGYPGFISQIITNLVINSLTHGFHKKTEGIISIDVQIAFNQLEIHYQDNGLGINEEVLNRIFDPFFTTNRKGGNTGLGMNIVYNIVVEVLKGSIECKSEISKGVSFRIQLPLL